MKRWVVVSHSSSGHIRGNGSLHHLGTHRHSTTDTHEDMLTHFCLRGCGKPTLHLPPKREGRGAGEGEEEEEERGVEERVKQRGGQRSKEWKEEMVRVKEGFK